MRSTGSPPSSTSAGRRSVWRESRRSPIATSRCSADDGRLPRRRAYAQRGARLRACADTSLVGSLALFAVGERTGWSVDEDARHLEGTARRLGYAVAPTRWARFARDQSVFLTSHFEALQPRWTETSHRLATAYLHGRPGTPGYPEFDRAYERLAAHSHRFARVQVTHGEMRDLVVAAGVPPQAVHVIPIGIDIEHFHSYRARRGRRPEAAWAWPRTPSSSARSRRTAPAGAKGSSRSSSRAPTFSSARWSACTPSFPSCMSSLPAPRADTFGMNWSAAGSRIDISSPGAAESSRAPFMRSMSVSLRHARRAVRRPRWNRWRRAPRSSRHVSARRQSSSSTDERAGSSTWTTWKASRAGRSRFTKAEPATS